MTGDPVADQADAVLRAIVAALPNTRLRGVYLFGSAVAGGLRPHSDIDLLAVIEGGGLAASERQAILDGILPLSGRATRPAEWRPVELTIVVREDVQPWRYPPRLELQYGEWLRDDAIAGTLDSGAPRPDVAILLTMVRDSGRPLLGPPAHTLLDAVPSRDITRAILEEVQPVLDDLETDTRNVVLTLARMWSTVATGQIRSKDAAAGWAIPRLPETHRPVLELARRAYLGEADDAAYDQAAVRAHAEVVVDEIGRAGALPPRGASV